MHEKLLIFQKIYDLSLWLYPIINRMPKNHRQVLGKKIEKIGLFLLTDVIKANKLRGQARTIIQLQISENLDLLRILIRLTKDLRFMSVKQYANTAEKINEIAKMLQSWMKVL